jgi:RNA polymerase sigma-70 factor (ECF subfamily)
MAPFADLFQRYQATVRSIIYQIAGAYELDDLTQEAFIRIWKARSELREPTKIAGWVYRVATNTALDALRANKRRGVSTEIPENLTHPAQPPDQQLANRQLVLMALQSLTAEHRVVLVLMLLHERTLEEVGEILDAPIGTVKSRLHYGREAVRQFLLRHGVEV